MKTNTNNQEEKLEWRIKNPAYILVFLNAANILLIKSLYKSPETDSVEDKMQLSKTRTRRSA